VRSGFGKPATGAAGPACRIGSGDLRVEKAGATIGDGDDSQPCMQRRTCGDAKEASFRRLGFR